MSQNSNIPYLNFLKKAGISTFLQNKPNIFYEIETKEKNNVLNNNISKIKKLSDLELLMKKTYKLKFKKLFNNTIIGEGNKKAKIFIIGKFSEEENQEMKPLIEESKKLLNKMLEAINLDRKDIYITNAIPWIINDNKKIKNSDILDYLPFIQRQIEIINPKIIVLMGSIATKVILNSNLEFTKLRGKWYQYKSINLDNSIECFVTYHPQHLIQFPKQKKYAWKDLQILQKKIQNEN